MAYLIGKLVHLLSLILWVGPPLGAYYILWQVHRSRDRTQMVWAQRYVERVLVVEHIAFVVLILSGAYLVWLTDGALLNMPWLQKKLWLFAGVLVFELVDIWISHFVLAHILEEKDPLDSPEWPRVERMRRTLAIAALPVAFILVPGIFYFAVAKQ